MPEPGWGVPCRQPRQRPPGVPPALPGDLRGSVKGVFALSSPPLFEAYQASVPGVSRHWKHRIWREIKLCAARKPGALQRDGDSRDRVGCRGTRSLETILWARLALPSQIPGTVPWPPSGMVLEAPQGRPLHRQHPQLPARTLCPAASWPSLLLLTVSLGLGVPHTPSHTLCTGLRSPSCCQSLAPWRGPGAQS